MEDFKYLGNNDGTMGFPMLSNLNVEKSQTTFNWSVWGKTTKLYLKHVPAIWTSDYENVVQFNSAEERNAYLRDGDPIVLETDFKIPYEKVIRLPIPYDSLINFNYITAVYPDTPVPHYGAEITRNQYCYFIEDCIYISPNTTEIRLDLDIWTTYVDDINISGMMLERGHYPMTLTDVDSYLNNPISNISGLLTADVNFGELLNIPKDHVWNLYDSNVVYVVATTSDPRAFNKTVSTFNGGQSNKYHDNVFYYAVQESDWNTFCTNLQEMNPAHMQTIQGIIAIPKKLISLGNSFSFCGVSCYQTFNWNLEMNYKITKADFAYDSSINWITKLYTSPYAMVEIIDWNGESKRISVEELYVGSIVMKNLGDLNFVNPLQSIVLLNVGGSGLSNGQKVKWDLNFPTSGININPKTKFLFETEYSRLQTTNEINQDKAIADNNALIEKTNSTSSAKVAKDNAARSITLANDVSERANTQQKEFTIQDLELQLNTLENDLQYAKDSNDAAIYNLYIDGLLNYMGLLKDGMLDSAMTLMGGISSAGGAIIGGTPQNLFSSGFSMIAKTTGLEINIEKTLAMLNFQLNAKALLMAEATGADGGTYSEGEISLDVPATEGGLNRSKIRDYNFKKDVTVDQNTKNFTRSETDRTQNKTVATSNNTAQYNNTIAILKTIYDNAIDINTKNQAIRLAAIANAINQSELNNNVTYGSFGDSSSFANDKMAMHYHIITQSKEAIKKTANYFLMYGYSYENWMDFTNWNLMKHFTYWKSREIWLSSDKCNSDVIKKFKRIVQKGVIVWRNVSEMGTNVVINNKVEV